MNKRSQLNPSVGGTQPAGSALPTPGMNSPKTAKLAWLM